MEENIRTQKEAGKTQGCSLAQMECFLKDAKMSLAGLEQMETLLGKGEKNLEFQ